MLEINYERVIELFTYRDGCLYRKIATTNTSKVGELAGGPDSKGYWRISINDRRYLAHRLIWLYHNRSMPLVIDHIDGDPLNNRIENLRECTLSQNSQNSKMRADNTSGVKGVHWDKNSKKWITQIQTNGERVRLGSFKSISLAESVIKNYRDNMHKEYANHGQPIY